MSDASEILKVDFPLVSLSFSTFTYGANARVSILVSCTEGDGDAMDSRADLAKIKQIKLKKDKTKKLSYLFGSHSNFTRPSDGNFFEGPDVPVRSNVLGLFGRPGRGRVFPKSSMETDFS